MNICAPERFRPFSHALGSSFFIPNTEWKVKVFPCLLEFYPLASSMQKQVHLFLSGPIEPFTVEQDLERVCLRIFGQSQKGYFRFCIERKGSICSLLFEKTPSEGILVGIDGEPPSRFYAGMEIAIGSCQLPAQLRVQERLFLGMTKQQDLELIRRRQDLREILPLWYQVGLLTPSSAFRESDAPVIKLIQEGTELVIRKEKLLIYPLLKNLFFTGFSGGFVPRLEDEDHQGILASQESCKANPLSVLLQSASLIRSLFFQENGYQILPCLPPQFACGRMTGILSGCGDVIDMEWSKKELKKLAIRIDRGRDFHIEWPSYVKTYRLRRGYRDRGEIFTREDLISAASGQDLWFDRFQK